MSMVSEEEALAAQYARRQDLLKQLNEVNGVIRSLEQKLMESATPGVDRMPIADSAGCDSDAEHMNSILDRCLQDSNGLRDAMKFVDACKAVREAAVQSESKKEKHSFCNRFVHKIIARSPVLALDSNGSELLQNALGLLKSGGSVAPTLHSTDYIAAADRDLSEMLLLLTELQAHIPEICYDTNGTRVVQKIFDYVKSVEELELCAKCFADSIIPLCKDINGSHAIARLLAAARQVNFCDENGKIDAGTEARLSGIHETLYKNFAENCVDVCRNRQGCCIIQKCLQWTPEPYFSAIIDTVLQNTLKLVNDPFGNYVVQFILDNERELSQRCSAGQEATNYTNRTIRQMLHNVASLSCDKFSSNVIEKCLRTVSPDVRQLLVDELTDPQVLPKLLTDSYANYVIQTAIVTSSVESQFAQLRDSIMPLQNLLRNSPYGVKVEAKLARRQRAALRKPEHQKEQGRRSAAPSHFPEQGGAETLLTTQLISGVPTIPTLMGSEPLQQNTVAFSGISEELTSVMTQPQYMQLMFQGQQALIGLQQGHSQQPFQVNMMKEPAMWGPQQSFTLFQQPNQRKTDR
ncbi:pumilio protein 6 [Trypanosoma conorhini]|uniref:Pumilio protein 6 n=1 Tax=Trypanosoma conorhini TaxID=83891 RepID=A0A422P8X5_9TRYP|nr:pumilio protein 6 [Trypanosoma conorhini]RNF14140.1 pumilio protein 6 [Trypanosoma conorhini]